MRELLLREATGAAKSKPTTPLGALLDIGPLQNSISLHAANAYFRIKNAHEVKLLMEYRLRVIRNAIARICLFGKKYKMSLSSGED